MQDQQSKKNSGGGQPSISMRVLLVLLLAACLALLQGGQAAEESLRCVGVWEYIDGMGWRTINTRRMQLRGDAQSIDWSIDIDRCRSICPSCFP